MAENGSMGLASKAVLDKIDKLRELNVPSIDLLQLVVVGDQSSGKSSVLESDRFLLSTGTRYLYQVCNSDILPSGYGRKYHHFDYPRPEFGRANPRATSQVQAHSTRSHDALADVMQKANTAMNIRSSAEDTTSGLQTFNSHILKIEISGTAQEHLTVIDVPGIFRVPTPPFTTDSDVVLVKNMVKSYMQNSRTIILEIVPSNVDITTQEVSKMAEEADSEGSRTMDVPTKPDLVTEEATQGVVNDLLFGIRNNLRLSYFVVKNRGADDRVTTRSERKAQEEAFFESPEWIQMNSRNKRGVAALKARLSDLLMTISKKEFAGVKGDVNKDLQQRRYGLNILGPSRSDAASQRVHLGRISSQFQSITQNALDGHYDGDPVFSDIPDIRLITAITNLNEHFANVFWKKGHKRHISTQPGDDEGHPYRDAKAEGGQPLEEVLLRHPELKSVAIGESYECPDSIAPEKDSIMDNIDQIYRRNRGSEMGTFSGSILALTFKEQSGKREALVQDHVNKAVSIVHDYVSKVLNHICPDQTIRDFGTHLFHTYGNALKHAQFLLNIERKSNPITYNH